MNKAEGVVERKESGLPTYSILSRKGIYDISAGDHPKGLLLAPSQVESSKVLVQEAYARFFG